MPPNTVSVARPSRWGNPYKIEPNGFSLSEAVALYREWVTPHAAVVRDELHGKNLACYCPLDRACHADVLLDLANGPPEEGGQG